MFKNIFIRNIYVRSKFSYVRSSWGLCAHLQLSTLHKLSTYVRELIMQRVVFMLLLWISFQPELVPPLGRVSHNIQVYLLHDIPVKTMDVFWGAMGSRL